MFAEVNDFVLPGDIIQNLISIKGITVLGPGLRRHDEPKFLLATRAGFLKFKSPNVYWIDGPQKRYQPKKGDLIVGLVVKKSGEVLKVDIGASEYASLSSFAFEGATKKQKPDVQVGDAIYAKLLSAHREMEPELVCVDSYFKAGKLGPLSPEGFVINVSLHLVTRLLNIENPLLRTLGKKFVYEIAVGMNGKIWINAKSTKDIFNIMTALMAAEQQSDKDIVGLCRQF